MSDAWLVLASSGDNDGVNPGLLGFVVVALLGVGTWLLIRSMNRQIKKIDLPDDREPESTTGPEHPADDDSAPR